MKMFKVTLSCQRTETFWMTFSVCVREDSEQQAIATALLYTETTRKGFHKADDAWKLESVQQFTKGK